jgi:hypothetical protein
VDSDDRFIVGDNALRVVRDNLEILEPQEDGGIYAYMLDCQMLSNF